MRYSAIDLQCEDIMWFGIDTNGYILAFTSGGYGPVPEYVCRSKEETTLLENFFLEQLAVSTDARMDIEEDGSPLADDAMLLAQKGVFSYDASFDEDHTDEYERIATPAAPLKISSLPDNIVKVLRDHIVDCDAVSSKYVTVKHAY